MKAALARSLASLRVWPGLRTWLAAALTALLFAPLAIRIGLAAGFLAFQPVSPARGAVTALVVFFTPALVEELLFRSWLPNWRETTRPWLWLAGSTAIFIAYHFVWVVALPGGGVFAEPMFLALAAAMGAICAGLRMRTGSLWPGVAFHWLTVTLWLSLFGGPYIDRLLGNGPIP